MNIRKQCPQDTTGQLHLLTHSDHDRMNRMLKPEPKGRKKKNSMERERGHQVLLLAEKLLAIDSY